MSVLRSLHTAIAGPSRLSARPLSSSAIALLPGKKAPSFSRPSPPKLPAEDQAEFEALLKANTSIGATPRLTESSSASTTPARDKLEMEHPDLRKGPKKQFEGDTNPRTGEVGGPKTDPFIAGQEDWQYGGRVTPCRKSAADDMHPHETRMSS